MKNSYDELSDDAKRSLARECDDFTYCPIPVRRHSFVIALLNEHIFKELKIVSVPWEEHSRKVDLFLGLKTMKAQITPNGQSYSGPYAHKQGLNQRRKHPQAINVQVLHTIVEGAGCVDWGNE